MLVQTRKRLILFFIFFNFLFSTTFAIKPNSNGVWLFKNATKQSHTYHFVTSDITMPEFNVIVTITPVSSPDETYIPSSRITSLHQFVLQPGEEARVEIVPDEPSDSIDLNLLATVEISENIMSTELYATTEGDAVDEEDEKGKERAELTQQSDDPLEEVSLFETDDERILNTPAKELKNEQEIQRKLELIKQQSKQRKKEIEDEIKRLHAELKTLDEEIRTTERTQQSIEPHLSIMTRNIDSATRLLGHTTGLIQFAIDSEEYAPSELRDIEALQKSIEASGREQLETRQKRKDDIEASREKNRKKIQDAQGTKERIETKLVLLTTQLAQLQPHSGWLPWAMGILPFCGKK